MYAPEEENLNWTTADISNIKTSAFADGSELYFHACRTGNWFTSNGSFAWLWAQQTHGTTYTFTGMWLDVGQSDYSNILGNGFQRNGFASKAYKTWRANRGEFADRPSEAWALPTASTGAFWGTFIYTL